jgi:adenylate cyclase
MIRWIPQDVQKELLMRKKQIYSILFLIGFWVSCSIFITVYDASVLRFKSEYPTGEYSLINSLLISVLVTTSGASLLGSLEVLLLSRLLRKKPFGMTLLIKTIVYMMFILVFLSLYTLYITSSEINKPMLSDEALSLYGGQVLSERFGTQILYWGIACIMALFLLQVSEKFGQGVLINFLRGKYHRPREERRIFMFMDLHSSTTYAERLGHIDYSHLIQDCYYDLTDIVVQHHAEVYQYVGDEVILTWDFTKGISEANCVAAYFAYVNHLKSRGDYYRTRYGFVPEFKAGLNSGVVTAAEVGEIKKELAYHGDVLNTASRIQGTCNEYQRRLLTSEQTKKELENQSAYTFDFMGNVMLKGKESCVRIYAVNVA